MTLKLNQIKIFFCFIIAGMTISLSALKASFQFPEDKNDSTFTRIDTHIHLYDTRREGSSIFLDPVKHEKIYFPHFAETFIDTAGPAGVNYAVVVEASKRREDNFWLMRHVDTSDCLLAFIANLDPRDPFFINDLDSLSESPKFRGIRIRPASPINIGEPQIIEKLGELASRNLVLELGGNGHDPSVVAVIARKYPGMNIIMNHLAGGRFTNGQIKPDDWKERLSVFASEPNVYCKISALYTLSGKNPAPVNSSYYDPLIDPVVEEFGSDRVIFGSNWTLSDMLGSYKNMVFMMDNYCERKGLSKQKFYFENILDAYGLEQDDIVHPEFDMK